MSRNIKWHIFFTFRRIPGESNLKLKEVERQLYRLRDKTYPERPNTHEGVRTKLNEPEVINSYGLTLNKQHPFYINSVVEPNYAFHLFASYATINMIKEHIPTEKRNYLMDGTFKVVPKTFSQLFIIAIEYKNDVCTKHELILKRQTSNLNFI